MDAEAIASRSRRQERLAVGGTADVRSGEDTELERRLVHTLLGAGHDHAASETTRR